MNILFLNHKAKQCGVYQYGIRLYDILQKTENNINYIYKEIESFNEYNILITNTEINIIIYNYHGATMPWLNIHTIQKYKKNIGIFHEPDYNNYNLFNIPIYIGMTMETNSDYIPRPIFENIIYNNVNNEFINYYIDKNIPIFGSFGFGFNNKGFDKIVKMVNEQYDEAIIKLVIPCAHYGPKQTEIDMLIQKCRIHITKPGIILITTSEFFSNEELLYFLNSNTMNIFLYDIMPGRGLSSVIDYAISVKKPIGISDSNMFRHIYDDSICLYKNTIKDCLINSTKYVEKLFTENTNDKLILKFKNIIESI
jgi:hypothetical protein